MRHDGSPLAYGRSDALGRSCTYVSDGEYARLARFERQRLAVFLRYFADLDYRSIATALDVAVGTVSATLATAHAALRRAHEEAVR